MAGYAAKAVISDVTADSTVAVAFLHRKEERKKERREGKSLRFRSWVV